MTSRPGQPRLAMRYQWLLFHPVINIQQCLWGHTQYPKGPEYRYTGFSGKTGLGLLVTMTLSPRPMPNALGGTLLLE